MPRSVDRDRLAKKAEGIAKDAFFNPAYDQATRAKQRARWGALRTLVGDAGAAKESPFLKYDSAGDEPPPPPKAQSEVAGGKGKFQARGGPVRKAMGGRVKKTYFSCY